jgi:hypothetical protein
MDDHRDPRPSEYSGFGPLPRYEVSVVPTAGVRSRRLRCLVTLLGATLILGVTGSASAQSDASRVEFGDSVRVRLPRAQAVDASFRGWDQGVMLLRVQGLEGQWNVPVRDLSALSVYTTRTPREGLRHYSILGAVSGLFLGAAVGLALHTTGVIDDPTKPPAQIITNALKWSGLGVVGGLLAGGVLGGRHPGAGWVGISLPSS